MDVNGELKCYYEQVRKEAPGGVGVRHLQVVMMFLVVTVLYIIRCSMGVAILAMTDHPETVNTNIANYNVLYETYEWDEQTQGVILSSFFWGYIFNQVPGGIIAQKFGAKSILLGSLIVNGLINIAIPFVVKFGGWQAVVVMRFLTGLTQCLLPCCHSLLGKWVSPQERTTLSNFAYTGIPIGTIISMPLCGILSRSSLGWKMIFFVNGVIALITAVLWQILSANTPRSHKCIKTSERKYIEESLSTVDEKYSPPIPWKALATSIPLAALVATHTGFSWNFTIFFTFIPSYTKYVLNIDLKDSGVLAALPYLVMWVMNLIMSFILEQVCNKKLVSLSALRKIFNSIGSFGPAVGMIALSYFNTDSAIISILILCFTVGCQAGGNCGYMINHLDLSPNHAGILYGITNCISNSFSSMGPTVAGFILGENIHDIGRWRILFLLSSSIGIVTNVIFLIWGTSEKQKWDEPDYKFHRELDLLKSEIVQLSVRDVE